MENALEFMKYMKQIIRNPNTSLFYSESELLENSDSLLKHGIIKSTLALDSKYEQARYLLAAGYS